MSPATAAGDVVSETIPISFPGLQAGVAYTFTVTATNFTGTSITSAPFTASGSGANPPLLVQVDNDDGQFIDAATGDLVQPDGSEVDPVTFNTVIAAPESPPVLAELTGYLLTVDPTTGLYTSFFGTFVDITTGDEYDAYLNYLDTIDLTNAYLVTDSGTVVRATDLSTQLDPSTLNPVNSDPYTVEATPWEYSVANGPAPAAAN